MKTGEDFNLNSCHLSSRLFTSPLFKIEHYSTTDQAGFVGLFIGHFSGIDWLNIVDTNNYRCGPRKNDRHKNTDFWSRPQ
jgi:hypothetical protein